MFQLLLSLILTAVIGVNYAVIPAARSDAGEIATSLPQGKSTRLANNFPGADLGAKINAADNDLGSKPGEILVRDGGTIATQVTITSGHTLRFGPGTYTIVTESLWEGAFLLKSGATVIGSGWDTVIVEPPRIGWIVFQTYENIRSKPTHSGIDSNITVTNLQIKGANPAVEGSVRQTVSLGNCHQCRVEKVWFNGTGIIGVAAGGNALAGNFADTVTIKNNLFTRLAGQAVAVVNGRNIVIDGNTFKDSGRAGAQGMTAIDVEPNNPSDIAQRIDITNNLVDSRGSSFLHGNGILVQNGAGTSNFGPVLVKGNTVIGGEMLPNISGLVATGIYISGYTQNVTVIDNIIRRVAHSGIRLEYTTRNYVANNKLISTGTGGIPAFDISSTTDSQIINNVVTVDPSSPLGTSMIQEHGASRNNVYRGNTDGRGPLAPMLLSDKP